MQSWQFLQLVPDMDECVDGLQQNVFVFVLYLTSFIFGIGILVVFIGLLILESEQIG